MTALWSPGAVTGVGSMPGGDPSEAARLVFGELPALPHLAELPARGLGSDMIGRTASLLIDLPVEVAPSSWRFSAHDGRDLRRARDALARDLDALEEVADGYAGPLKLQLVGPWTLASNIELASGHKVVTDPGASRDLVESLAEGARTHLADVQLRVPGAALVLQLDEPGLNAVLDGQVPTPSGYGTVRSVESSVVEDALRSVLAVGPPGGRVVHSCAADVPIELLRRVGVDAISLDALRALDRDALGEAVDAGVSLWLGVVPSTDAAISVDRVHAAVTALWNELGFPSADIATAIVLSPTCGLAHASPAYVRRALAVLRDVGARLLDA